MEYCGLYLGAPAQPPTVIGPAFARVLNHGEIQLTCSWEVGSGQKGRSLGSDLKGAISFTVWSILFLLFLII